MEKLKRCPFCGGIAMLSLYFGSAKIVCTSCGARTKTRGNRKGENFDYIAIVKKLWNRRVANE